MTILLATDRVVIRPFVPDDAPMVHARLNTDPRQMQFTGSVKTVEETRESLRRQIEWTAAHPQGLGKWAVVDRRDDGIVGGIALVPLLNRPEDIEVGYITSPEFWRQGFATDAVKAIVGYGFEKLGLPIIHAAIHPDNQAAVGVALKVGMTVLGSIRLPGQERDCDLYGVHHPQLPDIDSLWNYDDLTSSEINFQSVVSVARLPGSVDYRAELFTQMARCLTLQRRFDEGHAALDEVDRLLSDRTPKAKIRYLLERGRIWNDTGRMIDAALDFERAFHLASAEGRDALAVDAAHMLGMMQPYADAARWNQRAIAIAEASGEPRARRWTGTLYISLGWNYQQLGRYSDAERAFASAVPALEQIDHPGGVRAARLCMVKNRRLLGDPGGALPLQQRLLTEIQAAGEPEGYVFEEIAECLLALGKVDEAKPYFARAYATLSTYPWFPPNEMDRLQRLRIQGGLK